MRYGLPSTTSHSASEERVPSIHSAWMHGKQLTSRCGRTGTSLARCLRSRLARAAWHSNACQRELHALYVLSSGQLEGWTVGRPRSVSADASQDVRFTNRLHSVLPDGDWTLRVAIFRAENGRPPLAPGDPTVFFLVLLRVRRREALGPRRSHRTTDFTIAAELRPGITIDRASRATTANSLSAYCKLDVW